MSRDYSLVRTIVTRDYEAMCAYKGGLYEQCFHLSSENIDFLLCNRLTNVLSVESDLLLLVDVNGLSLISLAILYGVFDIDPLITERVTQLIYCRCIF